MKLNLAEILIIIATILLTILGIVVYSHAGDYFGEVWYCEHGQGTKEYILNTSFYLNNEIRAYVIENEIEVKKYCYLKKNKNKIIKCEMANTLDEIMTKQNSNSVGNKKLKKFEYKGQGKNVTEELNKWRKGEVFE